ncbi:MAG: hypothetical protein N2C14_24645, partial [Planctomycetales bacterium]
SVKEGFQFSIRHLLYLTLLVAVLITLGKAIPRQQFPSDELIAGATLCVCFGSIAVAAVWASLGVGSPLIRTPILLLFAGGVGMIPPYYLGIENWYVAFPCLTGFMAFVVCLSLLVYRGCGYRVTRRESSGSEESDVERECAES